MFLLRRMSDKEVLGVFDCPHDAAESVKYSYHQSKATFEVARGPKSEVAVAVIIPGRSTFVYEIIPVNYYKQAAHL